MSSLINPLTNRSERHDSLLSMLIDWSQEPTIAKTLLGERLVQNEHELEALAEWAHKAGRGDAKMPEVQAAGLVLGIFLVNRKVRRVIASHVAKDGVLRKGAAMKALGEMKDQLSELVGMTEN